MQNTRIRIKSGNLLLEGIVCLPQGNGPFPVMVVCHPHSQYGGSMENNVVNSLCETTAKNSIISLKFNFRGVGGSQGAFSNGTGEQEDVQAAISFAASLEKADPSRIGVCGYSAGAAWGLAASYGDARVKTLAAISPPLDMFDFSFLKKGIKPVLLISGSEDSLIPTGSFLRFCKSLPEFEEYCLVKGADHLWWGYEAEAAQKTVEFFLKTL